MTFIRKLGKNWRTWVPVPGSDLIALMIDVESKYGEMEPEIGTSCIF